MGCCILVREREKHSEIASICKFCADLCRIDGRIVGGVASLYEINGLENHSINIKKMAENCQKLKILQRENYTHKNKIEVPKIGKKVGGQWAEMVLFCKMQIENF